MLRPSEAVEETHLKSLLDVALDNSKTELNQLRENLIDNPGELAKKEREFMLRECAKLENIGNLQVRLDAYREAQQN